ncbi:MAG: anti-sigma factor [Burkholderiaceae bacterium]
MNLDNRDDRTVAAGEYVLGTLSADERRDFEHALANDATLQAEVYQWQDRLLPLAERAAGDTHDAPDAATWAAIDARLATPTAPRAAVPAGRADAANDALWQRLRRWQLTAGGAIAASIVLAALLLFRAPEQLPERYVAVLQAPGDTTAGWIVEAVAGERLVLRPVGPATTVPPGRALQFWTKTVSAAGPTSLGLVPAGQVTEVPLSRLPALEAQQLFELTLEPETGSPIGRPTGPILYVGRTVRM